MKSKTIINAVLPLLILFSACSRKNPTDPFGKGYLAIKLVPAPADTASIQKLDSLRCIISKDGNNVLDNYLSKEGTDFRAQFDVEPGTGYAILLYGMKAGAVAYRGNKNSIRVTIGKTTSVPIAFSSFQVILVRPVSGSANNDNTPAFRWSALSGAMGYALQASISSDFSTLAINQQELTTTTFTPTSSLSDGNYHWRVRGRDNLGNWGSWSSIWSCTIKTTGPPAPTLSAPVNGTATADNTPTFSWNAATAADGYQLQASASNDFAALVIDQQNLTTTSYTPSTSLNDGIYYWRARVKDNSGNWGNWSEVWSITIQTSGPPAPTLTSPVNGGITRDNTPAFEWYAMGDAVIKHLQMSTNNNFEPLIIDEQILISPTYTPNESLIDGTYYWRARSKDSSGNWGLWSAVWSFRIKTAAPPAPILLAPESSSVSNFRTPTYRWNMTPETTFYNLQVSTTSNFTNLIIDARDLRNAAFIHIDRLDIRGPLVSVPLNDGTYYWRVQAGDGVGNLGTWSEVWSFTVTSTGPSAPTLAFPANDSLVTGETITLHWHAVPNVVNYSLQVGIKNSFETIFIEQNNLTSTSYTTNFSPDDAVYYWRVRGKDNMGIWSGWSEVWHFKFNNAKSMIYIPDGWFSMGSNQGDPDEQPVHSVYIDAFYMDKHEVTNAQYKTFCDATGRKYPPDPVSGYFLNYPNYPVVNVTWDEAKLYAGWVGKRLPTEAEWEKASRGGLEGKAYPWGDDDASTRCNYLGYNGALTSQMANLSNGRGPLPKGSFTPNGYGLYDMVGNVSEWCNDLYEANYYANSPDHNPQGPSSGTPRVAHGGSWNDTNSTFVRCAERFYFHPGTRDKRVGFRCARTP